MKKVIFFLYCLGQTFYSAAQITDELGNIHILKAGDKVETILKKKNSIYLGDASQPTFIGGDEKMQTYLFKQIKYVGSKEQSALVRFLVTDDGEVQIPFLLRKSGNDLFDNEVLRVMQSMTDWTPAMLNGEYVNCYRTIEVEYGPFVTPPSTPNKIGEGMIYETIDVSKEGNSLSEYAEGTLAMYRKLSQNVKYPAVCRENNIQGTVSVKFVIEKDGTASSAIIDKSSGSELLDAEALRVISVMEGWTPAKIKGKPVRSYYFMPVVFKLEG